MNLLSAMYNVSSVNTTFKDDFLSMFKALKSPEMNPGVFDQLKAKLNEELHAEDHPYGELVTPQVLESLELTDLKTFYKAYVNTEAAYLTIAGDITPAAARALVETAGRLI